MIKYRKRDYTNCRCNICEIVDEYDDVFCNVATEDVDKIVEILNDYERLKKIKGDYGD